MPGSLLAGRYRLVALLGRGGMGEVYRAEDTRLGQTVALKFLPDAVARDPDTLERFYAEVRIGRQITHPNVCRIYDLIELEGQHCLSMEYVDGEDLGSLLARIGRLPAAKLVEIARELAAGLAAVHDKGVIHRDLKPANVMIDGKGRARLADFGIAALADEVDGEVFAGTPAYMAPEQLAGQPASVRSDLYAFGLVLYEACTGQRRFQGRSLTELRALQQNSELPSLADTARDIPPALERLVLRCLEKNPEQRPASARALLAALPGGDSLQAAVAAGETPSPAMVAAASKVGDLQAGHAWGGLLLGLFGLLAVAWLAAQSTLIGALNPPHSPELLRAKARDLLTGLGYRQAPVDWHGGFAVDEGFRRWARTLPTAQMLVLRPGAVSFHYREAQAPLVAVASLLRPFGPADIGRITRDDPAPLRPGMISVDLDIDGRLTGLRVVSSGIAGPGGLPDWSGLLALADLALDSLQVLSTDFVVPVDSDTRQAWRAERNGQPGIALQVEAASLQGRIVWLRLRAPWTPEQPEGMGPAVRAAVWTILAFSVLAWVVVGRLIRRNLALGRGDRRGALRLSAFLMFSSLLALLLRADHVSLVFEEAGLVVNMLAQVLLYALVIWLVYLALEPVARRHWPHLLVSWSRLLEGRLRDPLVGRDMLLGVLVGTGMTLVLHLAVFVPVWMGGSPGLPRAQVMTTLGDIKHLGYFLFSGAFPAVIMSLSSLFGLYIFRTLLRQRLLALITLYITTYFGMASMSATPLWSLANAVFSAIYLLAVLRIGLLAGAFAVYTFLILEATPLSLQASAWYFDRTLVSLGLLSALLVYGFWTALAGKPMFGGVLDADD